MKFLKNIFLMLLLGFFFSGYQGFNHSGINVDRQIKNLRAFAKLYGYVRFFHPSDEASKIDWDKFAIYGADRVKHATIDAQLNATLKQLFLPIAPTAQIYSANEKPKDISEYFPKDTTGLKVVAWQHQGVGLAEASFVYHSIRTNKNYIL